MIAMVVTLAVKIRAICEQLGVENSGLTAPIALQACNDAMGIKQSGPLITQTEVLVKQLGLNFDAPQQLVKSTILPQRDLGKRADEIDIDKPASSAISLSVLDIMSSHKTVHKFSEEVTCKVL